MILNVVDIMDNEIFAHIETLDDLKVLMRNVGMNINDELFIEFSDPNNSLSDLLEIIYKDTLINVRIEDELKEEDSISRTVSISKISCELPLFEIDNVSYIVSDVESLEDVMCELSYSKELDLFNIEIGVENKIKISQALEVF